MNRNKYIIFAFTIAFISLSLGRQCFVSKIKNENKMFIEVESKKERRIKKLELKLANYAYVDYKTQKKQLKNKFGKEKKRKCKEILKREGEFEKFHNEIHEVKKNFIDDEKKIRESLVIELNELEENDSESFRKESKEIFKKHKKEMKELINKTIDQYKKYILNIEKEAKKYENID